MNSRKKAFRAKHLVTLAGEAPARTRQALEAPFSLMEDGVIVTEQGRILAVEPYSSFKRHWSGGCELTDLGEVRIAPALVNAHCHLELSHLAGKTLQGKGFAAWMHSLLPLAGAPVSQEHVRQSIHSAISELKQSGTAHVGDVGSRHPALVAEAVDEDCGLTHFLEVLGYRPPAPQSGMPDMFSAEGYEPAAAATLPPERHAWCALSGHALYSTRPEALRAAWRWCCRQGRPYSLHLAESEEENDCIERGRGELFDLLSRYYLPADRAFPGKRPVAYADTLGLLGPETLAVHCVHCSPDELEILAARRTKVCLCPRSNQYIGVGQAPAGDMAEAGVLLCLGTDSLASNTSLDMQAEMRTARKLWGFSERAVLRMASLNGAEALGLAHLGSLASGKAAAFFIYPEA